MEPIHAAKIHREDGIVTVIDQQGATHRVPPDGNLEVAYYGPFPLIFAGVELIPARGADHVRFSIDSHLTVVPLYGATMRERQQP